MIRFFLRQPVITNLITLFCIVVGGYQFLTVRREGFPEIDFDIVTISTLFPGGSPEEVDRLVTAKIEDELRGVSGLAKVLSTSVENRSLITLRMDDDLSRRQVDRVINDVEQAMNRVSDLPDAAERPIVQEITSDRSLITLSVAGGDEEIRRGFSEELSDAIEDIPGVSRVEKTGYHKREIWVEADRQKLTQADLSLAEVAETVRGRNVDMSAGSVDRGNQELWVRVTGSVRGAEGVGEFILRGNDARQYLRVKDVARVTERFEEPRMIYKANGQRAVNLNVRKLRSGDTIKLADAVRKVSAQFEAKAASRGLSLVISDDWSFFIRRRLQVMKSNMYQGGFLVMVALFIFLDWRLALVAVLGVPISFAAAFMVAVPMGLTINLMSLLAFIIVLGMLDDDSVVVAENIYRHLEMGKPPLQAALEGAQEVLVPVLGSVAASCCAFLPFALMTGIMGKFLLMIPVIVILAFVASAFEAFCILPGHVVELIPLGRPVSEESESRGWFRPVQDAFRSALSWAVHHRAWFMVILVLALVGTGLTAYYRLKFVLFPQGLVDQFFVQLEMPEGTNLTATEKAFQPVESLLQELPAIEREAVTATIGEKGWEEEARMGTHYAQARVFLTPEERRQRKTDEIIQDLRDHLPPLPAGARILFDKLRTGPPVGKPIQVRVRGREPEVNGQIADRLKSALAAMDGVEDIEDSREGGKNQLRVVLNNREAGFANLNVAGVAQNILYAVDGGEASVIRRSEEQDEIKIRVRLLPDQRTQAAELLSLPVQNQRGRPVRLGAVADIEQVQGPPFLERYNFRPSITVAASVDEKRITSREANDAIRRQFKNVSQEFPGYQLVFGGEEEETMKSLRSLLRSFLIALLLDFVILASIFRSYTQPFLILLTVPIGLLGVVYALLLHNQPASFMSLLGVVAMTGVVVNNGIVLINFINLKRQEGLSARDAAVEGAVVRLRPIWASSLTTLLGLLPTAYGGYLMRFGLNGYEPFVAPMALSLAWGLMFAMPLTLFLLPVAYVTLADGRKWGDKLWRPLGQLSAGWVKSLMGAKGPSSR